MDLVNIWVGILAFSIFMYVVLDGFDLGVGIAFLWIRDAKQRDQMISSIAPVWDGNETWLIFTGVCFFGIFPEAYSIMLSSLYIPVITMLLGLVFRGVAFEFREAGGIWKSWWDNVFNGGSILVAFTQGIILGSLIQGINIVDGHYIGNWFDWATPFSFFIGLAVVGGYTLIGTAWLILKTTGLLQTRARHNSTMALVFTFITLMIVSIWTPFLNGSYFHKWFSLTGDKIAIIIPLLSVLAVVGYIYGIKKRRQSIPFMASILLFISGYLGVIYTMYPYILPPSLTFEAAAAPVSSLKFLLSGTLVLLPLVTGYFIYSHWVFRGKISNNPESY
jgi:cytochrome d ubiquinol oxidase subunit II